MRSKSRALGALLGSAVGDALGSTLEFTRPEVIPFPSMMQGPHTEMLGGGAFGLLPGQVTDDTHMATCIASSMVEIGGFSSEDVLARYTQWAVDTFDIGSTTSSGLRYGGEEAWVNSRFNAASNGSLMRTVPIGALSKTTHQAILSSLLDSSLTHFDPRCQMACASYNSAVFQAITYEADEKAMWAAAQLSLILGRSLLNTWYPQYSLYIDKAYLELKNDLEMASKSDPGLTDVISGYNMGYVGVAFRLAFWELLHAPSFEAGLVDVVNRGGDSDTTGAIAGGLLGAFHGVTQIPSRWIDSVLKCEPAEPFNSLYHPRIYPSLIDFTFNSEGQLNDQGVQNTPSEVL